MVTMFNFLKKTFLGKMAGDELTAYSVSFHGMSGAV
jgi:hypothetical protein